jgi:hypothetical protein
MSSVIEIQNLLSTILHANVDRPSEDICIKIAGLQGLAEMGGSSVRAATDWRRGSGTYQAQPKWRKGPGQHQQQQQQQQPYSSSMPVRQEFGTLPSIAGRYQSKFKNSSQPVEEKILNNIILSKLNKFSQATYVDVRDFLYQILGGGEADLQEFVRDFMRLVFKKAASEEIFCPLYAKLLSEISTKYTVILEEMNLLSDNYLEIFEEITEEGAVDYASFVQKNSEKKYRLGYSQFLSELVKQEILPLPILSSTFNKLITLLETTAQLPEKRVLVEEYTDCLLKMSSVFKGRTSSFSKKARDTISPLFMKFYEKLETNKDAYISCSPKSGFILMDIRDILKVRGN